MRCRKVGEHLINCSLSPGSRVFAYLVAVFLISEDVQVSALAYEVAIHLNFVGLRIHVLLCRVGQYL